MRIDDFIEASNAAASVDALFTLYKAAMAAYGFDRLVFSLMTDHNAIQQKAGHGIMLNYPDDWMAYYTKHKYETFDPVRVQISASDSIFAWDELLLQPGLVTKKQLNLLKQGEDAGLRDGIGIPLRAANGAIAGVGAASSAGGVLLDKNTLSRVNLLTYQFYTAFLNLERKLTNKIILSAQEREILQWFARGKTRWEVGELMAISENTVTYHLRRVFKKLDTNNITPAVLKALNAGLIQP